MISHAINVELIDTNKVLDLLNKNREGRNSDDRQKYAPGNYRSS